MIKGDVSQSAIGIDSDGVGPIQIGLHTSPCGFDQQDTDQQREEDFPTERSLSPPEVGIERTLKYS